MRKIVSQFRETWAAWSFGRKILAMGAVCLLLGFVVWVWPTRVDEVVRFDGEGAWNAASAPPTRTIVWQPAQPILLPEPEVEGSSQAVSPALTDAGATLYFSQRTNAEPAEIVRARFREGAWQRPEMVEELNSPADDLGPVLSDDGRELHFFSNRAESRGGYDLFVSRLENGVWSTPQNLGPKINTPANEYDPCLDPSGRVLYFSSNRTEPMAQRAREGDTNAPTEWAGTMRAETGERTFDIYAAQREPGVVTWSPAETLAKVNLPEANEGAPHVSPDGAFLYFASDRIARDAEEANLDLYRIRLSEGLAMGEAENLGDGINTPAHETEPSLSPEGFRLLFASNREGRERIYVSTATEVYAEVTRDASHLRALANPWLWGAIVCAALLVSSLVLLVAYRRKLAEKIWPVRFFAASVVINTVFVLLLFLWKLPGVVNAIAEQFEEHFPSSQIVDEETLEAQEHQATVYSQLEDLPELETVPTDWPTESMAVLPQEHAMNVPSLPIDDSLPLSDSLPAHVPRTIVALRPAFSSPAPLAKPLTRSQPKTEILIPEEAPPELPKVVAEFLEKLPNQTAVAKTDSVSSEDLPPLMPTGSPADLTPSPVTPVPLSLPTRLPPASLAITKQLVRSSPEPSAPKQIAEQDQSTKLVAQPSEKEQSLPVDDPTVDRRESKIPQSASLPDASVSPLPLLKKEAIISQPAKLLPGVPGRSLASLPVQRRSPLPDRLAMVAELNQAPVLSAPKTDGQNAPNPEVAPDNASPAQRNLAETAAPSLQMKPAIPAPNALAKRAEMQPSPKQAPPKLARMTLKPMASVVDLAHPAEVHEAMELSALLSLRNPDTRQEMAKALGLAPEQEAAVKRGLLWLANHQNDDGSWSLHDFHQHCQKHGGGNCSGAGSERSNTAATGLALLPFLASGYVPGSKEYGSVVAKGLDWLIANQHADGKLQGPGDSQVMYSHGIAAIALCEAFAMTKEPRLGESATKAVDFIVKAQHQPSGGWRYNPNEHADTSVVGWQVMALKSAEMAGIAVPKATYDNVQRWLASVEGDKPKGGVFGYNNPHPSPAMTAEGLLCLQFLEEPRTSPRLHHGADYLLKSLPEKDQRDTSYAWYYATQVLYHLQGEPWEMWSKPLQKTLMETQDKEGITNGTWSPKDQWEQRGGRIYATSIKLLMLEIDYRHLPLYGSGKPIMQP